MRKREQGPRTPWHNLDRSRWHAGIVQYSAPFLLYPAHPRRARPPSRHRARHIHALGVLREAKLGLLGKLEANLASYGAGGFALHFQHVSDVAVVAVCPDLRLITRLDQLRRDANALFIATNAALKEIVHIQFSRALSSIFVASLVLQCRRSCDHTELLRIQTA